jgi:O-antigen ligase
MSKWLAFSLILFLAVFQYGENYWFYSWHLKWFLLLVAASLAAAVEVGKRTHWSATPALASTLLSGLYIFAFRDNQYSAFNLLDRVTLSKTVAVTTFSFITLTTAIALMPKQTLKAIAESFGWFCLLNSIRVISQALLGAVPFDRGGFLGNSSMNATMIAFTAPIAWNVIFNRELVQSNWRALLMLAGGIAPIVAVLLSGSSMAYGTLFVVIAALTAPHLWGRLPWWRFTGAGLASLVLFFALGAELMGPRDLLHDSGRLQLWKAAMGYWWENTPLWIGAGPGVSEVLLPYVQTETGKLAGEYFMWFHNDWLQLLFEQGIPGALSYLLVFFYAVLFACKKPELLASLLGLGAAALGNFPVHSPLAAFAGIVIVVLCLREGEEWRVKRGDSLAES